MEEYSAADPGLTKRGGGAQSEGKARTCERRRREAPNGGSGKIPPPGKFENSTSYAISWHLGATIALRKIDKNLKICEEKSVLLSIK